jgi:ssDNA-binding replication factor A large subunit
MKISQLTPDTKKDFSILVLVLKSTKIREYKNKQRVGKIFSVILIDDTGFEIKTSAFDETIESINKMLKEQSVYYATGGILKSKNKQCNPMTSDVEMIFNHCTTIEEAPVHNSIKKTNFQYRRLSEIKNLKTGTYADFLGVAQIVDELSSYVTNDQ